MNVNAKYIKDENNNTISPITSTDTVYNNEGENLTTILSSLGSSGGIPIGTIVEYTNSELPPDFLLCDGSEISRTGYAALFNVIGTKYGEGDGSTTFNLPSRNGFVTTTDTNTSTVTNKYYIIKYQNSYGSSDGALGEFQTIANLLYPIGRGFLDFTDTDYSTWLGFTWERELMGMTPIGYSSSDSDFSTVGNTGGSKTHTIAKANIPSYNLTVTDPGHTHAISILQNNDYGSYSGYSWTESSIKTPYNRSFTTTKTGITVSSGGSGTAINHMNPYQVVSYWKRTA